MLFFGHRHKWTTTHINQYYIPTKQKCRCGLSRSTEKINKNPFEFWWIYSDGTKEPDERHFKHKVTGNNI
jgi:hypothetical protein